MVRRFGPAHRLGTARLVGAGAWAAAVLCASSAGAQTITVDIPPSNATQLAEALGTSTDELVRQMEAEIAALYGMLNVKEYLRLSANAQTMVSSGNAADYGSNPDGFFFGIGAGGALSATAGGLRAWPPTVGSRQNSYSNPSSFKSTIHRECEPSSIELLSSSH